MEGIPEEARRMREIEKFGKFVNARHQVCDICLAAEHIVCVCVCNIYIVMIHQ